MKMNVQIDSVIKRARGYWFVDGFIEIAAGGFFLLLAGILLLQGNALQFSDPSRFLSVVGEVSLVKVFGLIAVILGLWWLKDHFTYPRTGFVRSNRITSAQVLIVIRNVILFLFLPILGLLAVALLVASVGRVLASMPVWFPIGVGLIWAVLCVLGGEWAGIVRFRLLGGMILLAGLAIGFWQLAAGLPSLPTDMQSVIMQPVVQTLINRTLNGLGFLVLISGVLLTFSGLVTFLRYRQANPTPYTEQA